MTNKQFDGEVLDVILHGNDLIVITTVGAYLYIESGGFFKRLPVREGI